MYAPGETHLKGTLWVLCHLNVAPSLGILLSQNSELQVLGFSDADGEDIWTLNFSSWKSKNLT